MLATVLALAVLAAAPQTPPTYAWGDREWSHGRGPLSRHYFEYGRHYPSSHELSYGEDVGSFYYLIYGNQVGSSYFWRYGRAEGSVYFWRFGRTAGSRYYWRYGRGCLSQFGWRNGAACTGGEALVLQILCIAQAIDIDPCRAINARLDERLSRDSLTFVPGASAETVARMRERIERID